jgi:hypothetical protein
MPGGGIRLTETCVFHEEFKEQVKDHERRITVVETRLATGDEKFNSINDSILEIKDGQKWANRYLIGTLVTVVLTLLAVVY